MTGYGVSKNMLECMRSRHFGRDDRVSRVMIKQQPGCRAEPRQPTPGKPPLVKGATQRVGDFVLTNTTSKFHEKPGCIGPDERYLSPCLLKEETVIKTAGSTLLMTVFSQITGNQGAQVKLSIELNEPPLSRLHRDISPLNGGEGTSICWYKKCL